MHTTCSPMTTLKPNYTHILSDNTTVEKPSLKLINMAREGFTSTNMEVSITNVPYYNGLKAIFAKEPQNPYCQDCWNSFHYNTRYDEVVQEKCKYVGKGYCRKCKTGPFVVFSISD